ncbi:zinc-binding dehydrogenase [Kluyvera genomosp. 2]|uniref:zinc-binding dehydrogenase n=1 Tax=Kluyvera genomosp. 2 TaxID=2774054 RepID=UPI002FD823F1
MSNNIPHAQTHLAWTWQNSAEPHDLQLERIAIPQPAAGDVLVRNQVIGLNPVDWKVLTPGLVDWQTGHVPGVDGAGTVVALGEGVDKRWLGKRVAYHQSLARPGSYAELTPVAARALMAIPDALSFDVAASIPCPALTAWLAIEKLPAIQNAPLLISGAGGAVGHYLVQFAAARGFAITAMCNPRHWPRLQAMGAAHCIAGPLAPEQVWPEDKNGTFFAVIDSVNEDHAARLTPALKANGHIICIQGRLTQWPCAPFGRTLSMHEVALGALHWYGDDEAWNDLTTAGVQIFDDLVNNRLVAEETVAVDFDELPQLLDKLRYRQFSGKPLVRINP